LISSISNQALTFPPIAPPARKKTDSAEPYVLTESCQSFLRGLMERNPKERLGYQEIGLQKLRAHPWLSEINWDLAIDKKLKPSFVPDVIIYFLLIYSSPTSLILTVSTIWKKCS
jgi:serine/threonine protein kinase